MLESTPPEIIEGTWDEIVRRASDFNQHRLRVIVLPDEAKPVSGKMITQGMFPELAGVSDEDFEAAEFHGDSDDGLDWNA